MKSIVKRIVLAICLAIAIIIIAAIIKFSGLVGTVSTVKSVGGNEYLYEMTYKANYDLDEIIESDIDSNSALLEYVIRELGLGFMLKNKPDADNAGNLDVNCTSFQARNANGEGYLYGRNYDFFKNPTLVTHCCPKNGYSSIAVSDMSHFGYSLEKLPDSFTKKMLCIASIYAPVDGMNEKGLCTSIMALPKQASQQSTGKHCVGTTIIMRLWLDRCATVQEALDLLETLDVRHDAKAGSGYHYMVADASGDCAVVEFDKDDGWKTMIVRKAEDCNYMHVTNHLLSEKYYTTIPDPAVGNPNSHSWERYAKVAAYMEAHDGTVSLEEAQECLSIVHWKDLVWPNGLIEDTQYSNVYDQSALTLSLRNWNDYDTTVNFAI